MKLFTKLFKGKGEQPNDKKAASAEEAPKGWTVSSEGSGRKEKKRQSRKSKSKQEGEDPKASECLKVAEAWINLLNNHGTEEEVMSMFANPDVKFVFEDGFVLPASAVVPTMAYVFTCFPDFNLANQGYKEVEPGKVLIEDQILSATHTGEAFKFANFPAVPTTNKHVELDPECSYVSVNEDNKITKIEMISMGNLVGLHGMYLAIGGSMENPESEHP